MGPRLFGWLLGLTPSDFRREYGQELCRVAEERWVEVRRTSGPIRCTWFWMRQSFALVAAAARLRHHEHRTGGVTMVGMLYDVRHAVRTLLRAPAYALVTVLTLGLGIGATTAIFSALRTVLLRPLPYADAGEVVVLVRTDASTGERHNGVAAANMRDYAEASTLFSAVAVAEPWSLDLQLEDRAENLRSWAVSHGFFEAIGGEALLGRVFSEVDYAEGGSSVVLLGHRSWTNRFGADPSVVGQSLLLDGQSLTVVGVMPSDFRFPDEVELWVPRIEQSYDESNRGSAFMAGVGRLGPGVTLSQARAEASRIQASLTESHPRVNADLGYELVPLREHLLGDVSTGLWITMGAAAVLLLIACANVAGLMLARGAQRERDYALRGALGARTGRLVSHVSAESFVIALAGAGLGMFLTYGGVAAIRALSPPTLPRIDELRVDPGVLAFALLAAMLSAVLAGLAPSLRFSRPDLRGALGDGSRGSTGGRARARARSRLVVTQVAAAVVLLVGAGLLVRSFGVLLAKELGFDPTNRLAVQVFAYDYADVGDAQAFVDDAARNLLGLPGVSAVSMTSNLPSASDASISSIDITMPFHVADRDPPPEGQEPRLWFQRVAPGYFGLIGTEVVAGRDFTPADNSDGAPVAIVNETFARQTFGDADAVGQRILIQPADNSVVREIVGVVRDTRPLGHASEPRPEASVPLAQNWTGSITFVMETSTDAGALTVPAMQAIWDANPAQSVWAATPVESMVSDLLDERRFSLLLLGSFSIIALLLAAIGLYGLVNFSVERRVGELGIRRALGGRSADLVGMVVAEGARLGVLGLAIGLSVAWYLSRFMTGMLFEVEPTDPLTFAALGALVLAVAVVASLVPALRATRIDPVAALRSE